MPGLRLLIPIAAGLSLVVTVWAQAPGPRWLPGDSHIHSHWSPGYDRKVDPPAPIPGGDARYSTPLNASMARRFGLDWMVTTDHGGPNHSKLNLTQAYPELQQSRVLVPDVVQFYGMEINLPGMDHHTLIIPRSDDEANMLFGIESRFDANEAWPDDPARDTEAARLAALEYMRALPRLPLLFANHPSRSATGIGSYGRDEPWEFRQNNDAAPDVYRGMEGAPGHQAGTLARDGTPRRSPEGAPAGARGGYGNPEARTMGGFDQMTAIVGGLWDALLGEGRRFWIVATSDSHAHYDDPGRSGSDFWPGEFQKTYVRAFKTHDAILDSLRAGRIFVAAGDLISELDVEAAAGRQRAGVGDTLQAAPGDRVEVTIRFRDPDAPNHRGDRPAVARVDLIVGEVHGRSAGRLPCGGKPSAVADATADKAGVPCNADRNETTRVHARFDARAWSRQGEHYRIKTTLPRVTTGLYIRVRGTSGADLEPPMDPPGENPWSDLWFYSNPIFVAVQE